MAKTVLISVLCPDRVGLVAAIAGRLFDLGGNLSDTVFAVLGGGAEFTSICRLPDGVDLATVENDLRAIPELADADIAVRPFGMAPTHGPSGRVTHRITVTGGDRPGLIARLCEVFVQFKANVVRLNAQKDVDGGKERYSITADVWIPQGNAPSCLATIDNTAGELGLACRWEKVA
jgi:glycine cleavage system transcriptional repressor